MFLRHNSRLNESLKHLQKALRGFMHIYCLILTRKSSRLILFLCNYHSSGGADGKLTAECKLLTMLSSNPFCMMTVLVFYAHPDYSNFDSGWLLSGTVKYGMISEEVLRLFFFVCDIIILHLEMCCLHKEGSLVSLVVMQHKLIDSEK